MENEMTLYALTEQMAAIEDELYENGGELTPELEKELTETRESLERKVDGYNALYRKLDAAAENAASEIDRLKKLKRTAENARDSLKRRIVWHMNMFGLKKLEGRLCKMSLRSTKSLEVDNTAVLAPYGRDIERLRKKLPEWMTVEVKVSKTALKATYKGTDVLPAGVSEESRQSLIIR